MEMLACWDEDKRLVLRHELLRGGTTGVGLGLAGTSAKVGVLDVDTDLLG